MRMQLITINRNVSTVFATSPVNSLLWFAMLLYLLLSFAFLVGTVFHSSQCWRFREKQCNRQTGNAWLLFLCFFVVSCGFLQKSADCSPVGNSSFVWILVPPLFFFRAAAQTNENSHSCHQEVCRRLRQRGPKSGNWEKYGFSKMEIFFFFPSKTCIVDGIFIVTAEWPTFCQYLC